MLKALHLILASAAAVTALCIPGFQPGLCLLALVNVGMYLVSFEGE